MIAPRPLRPARAAVLALAVLALALAAPAAPGAPRAHAEGRSGTALVEYAPRSLAVPLSAAGPGRLELVDASGSVALSVRGGTVLAEAPEGGELSLRAVPDEGAYLASLRVGGRDASPAADGSLSLSAEEAAGGVEAAFAGGAPPVAGGPAAWVGGLTRTGDAVRPGGARPRPTRERPGPGSRRPGRSGGGRRLWNLAP